MAEQAYRIVDRRGTDAGWSRFSSTSIGFQDASKESLWREQFIPANKDAYALVGAADRIKLMTLGRKMYACDPIIAGVVDQMSSLATEIVIPQFDGEDEKWGTEAEEYLYENDKWIDVRGWPYTMNDQDRLVVSATLCDGDVAEILTEAEDGSPRTQLIEAHRIGTRLGDGVGPRIVSDGRFAGQTIIDGVIVDSTLRVLGYRVLGESKEEDKDYSVNDMRLHFRPKSASQVRGFSALAVAAIGMQDVHEARRLELIAQKKIAGTVLVEHNETGMASEDAEIITEGSEATATNGAVHPRYGRVIEGGETTIYRAGSQSKLEVLTGDRPTVNQREFSADVVRQAIHGIGWSVDYALDPTKAGGAQMRIVIENLNRTLDRLRKIVERRRKWVDAWRIAKAIKNGWLAPNPDWWKWEYQFASRLTADKKYDSETDMSEMTTGVGTLRKSCAYRGEWWEDVIAQKARELTKKLELAKDIASKFSIPIEVAMVNLGMLHPMELLTTAMQAQGNGSGDTNNQDPAQ